MPADREARAGEVAIVRAVVVRGRHRVGVLRRELDPEVRVGRGRRPRLRVHPARLAHAREPDRHAVDVVGDVDEADHRPAHVASDVDDADLRPGDVAGDVEARELEAGHPPRGRVEAERGLDARDVAARAVHRQRRLPALEPRAGHVDGRGELEPADLARRDVREGRELDAVHVAGAAPSGARDDVDAAELEAVELTDASVEEVQVEARARPRPRHVRGEGVEEAGRDVVLVLRRARLARGGGGRLGRRRRGPRRRGRRLVVRGGERRRSVELVGLVAREVAGEHGRVAHDAVHVGRRRDDAAHRSALRPVPRDRELAARPAVGDRHDAARRRLSARVLRSGERHGPAELVGEAIAQAFARELVAEDPQEDGAVVGVRRPRSAEQRGDEEEDEEEEEEKGPRRGDEAQRKHHVSSYPRARASLTRGLGFFSRRANEGRSGARPRAVLARGSPGPVGPPRDSEIASRRGGRAPGRASSR